VLLAVADGLSYWLASQTWFDYDRTVANTPDIASIAGLIGDRTRATILMCLMAGRSLTATELARASRVTKQTASSHLSKLVDARLVSFERAGRHRYFRLADHDVAAVIENLIGLAHRIRATQVDSGPDDPELRRARVCYDHLAGDLGVLVFDSMLQRNFLRVGEGTVILTPHGERFSGEMEIDLDSLTTRRRPLCLTCLDWSVRRPHLAGALGAAMLDRFYELGWARHRTGSRVVSFSAVGERSLRARFPYRQE
jgi:Predicted transcriptional regulators